MSFEAELEDALASAKPKLTLVPPPAVPLPVPPHFEAHRERLAKALEGGFYSMDDVLKAIAEGRAQFWPGKNAAMVTEIHTYPSETVLQVWLGAGDMEELLLMAPGIESWARLNGCTAVIVEGRQGWSKILKEKGYAPFSVSCKKVL
jgi:hypothetical protein